jgi:hypothetical protein
MAHFGFDLATLEQLVLNAVRATLLPKMERSQMEVAFRARFDSLHTTIGMLKDPMTTSPFLTRLEQPKPLLADGAMGTLLHSRGNDPLDTCFEYLCVSHRTTCGGCSPRVCSSRGGTH